MGCAIHYITAMWGELSHFIHPYILSYHRIFKKDTSSMSEEITQWLHEWMSDYTVKLEQIT